MIENDIATEFADELSDDALDRMPSSYGLRNGCWSSSGAPDE